MLVYHGLGATKEVQRKECRSLAEAGLLAVAVDAWGHGERLLPDFAERMGSANKHEEFLDIVHRSTLEIPGIIDALVALLGDRAGRFGVVGISMGGYIAFAAAAHEPRLQAFVPILGSPDWTVGARGDERLLPKSPHRGPRAFAPRALFAANAGQDRNVPAEAARSFVDSLRRAYVDSPGRLDYREYPLSEHFMRPEDWDDLWGKAVRWMERFLGE